MATIGTDPEFFVKTIETGEIVPVCGLLGGTKGAPVQIPGLPPGFGVQEDNVMAELTVPPALTADELMRSVEVGMDAIDRMLEPKGFALDRTLCEVAFSEKDLAAYPAALQFGCSIDYDGWKNGVPRVPVDPRAVGNWRFCGGHIHIGAEMQVPEFVGALFGDLLVGIPSRQYGGGARQRGQRRARYYGTPANYRPTPWGFEYRLPTNAWCTQKLSRVAAGAEALAALVEADAGKLVTIYDSINWAEVRATLRQLGEHGYMGILQDMSATLMRDGRKAITAVLPEMTPLTYYMEEF